MGACACNRNAIKISCVDIARRNEASHIRILGSSEGAVGTLCPPQTKLDAFNIWSSGQVHTRCIRADKRCKIYEVQNRRLEQLKQRERSLKSEQGLSTEHNCTVFDALHRDAVAIERAEIVHESFLQVRQLRLQVGKVRFRELELSDELKNFIRACKDGILALERCFPKISLEDARAIVSSRLPLRVSHRDLIQVCEERVHPIVLYRW